MRDPEAALEPADPEALYREVWMLKPKTLKRSLEGLEPDPYTWKPQSPKSPKNPVARKPSTRHHGAEGAQQRLVSELSRLWRSSASMPEP